MQRRKLQLRHRAYVTTTSLLRPSGSPWSQLYEYGDDSSLINLTSLDFNSFNKLLAVFRRHYDFTWNSVLGGRPGSLKTKHEVIGLVLMFYSATIEYKSLCGHFGIPPSTLARTLRKARYALLSTLKSVPFIYFCEVYNRQFHYPLSRILDINAPPPVPKICSS